MDQSIFEPCRPWLASQPRMNSWHTGCGWLWRQLSDWLVEYSRLVCSRVVDGNHPSFSIFLGRLWSCWAYHWHSGIKATSAGWIDGLSVATQVRKGEGFLGARALGGDVFRDVILAEAVCQKEDKAFHCLDNDFKDYCRRQAASMGFREDAEDWWTMFVDRLAGLTDPPGKLANYSGKCGLQNWLGTVVRNWVRDQMRKERYGSSEGEDLSQAAVPSTADDFLISQDCRRLWLNLLQGTLTALDTSDRLLLRLRFVEGLNGKETAAVVGIHPGNVSRREERALDALRRGLHNAEAGDRDEYQDCLRHLLQDRQRVGFAQAMVEALKGLS